MDLTGYKMPGLPKTEAPPTQNSQGIDKAEDEEKGRESIGAIMDESTGLGEKFNSWKENGKIALFGLGAVLVCAFLTWLAFPESRIVVLVGAIVGLVLAALICFTMLLKVGAEQELRERQKKGAAAAAKLEHGDVMSIINLNMSKLEAYYTMNKTQARNSFIFATIAICIGFLVIILTIRFPGQAADHRLAAGAVTGVLLQFIGGSFFYMYNKSLEQLKLFYTTLIRLQDTMLAVYQCNEMSEEAKDRVREKIILQLVGRRELRQIEDTKRHGSEKMQKATKEKAAGAA